MIEFENLTDLNVQIKPKTMLRITVKALKDHYYQF